MKKTEILAPAGSMQALTAAVAAGCDAVYMGGNRFGARAYAENPDRDEMIQAIRYCHLHGVKLYLTVNTLLKNDELQELYDFLRPFYEAGLDAVLVQDMGVLVFIHRYFPDLEIHLSTQMTVTQGRTAEFLKEYHVTRVVPARELTLQELKQMRKETDAEIEVFVHGALCYSYSGQCLFSSMLGGRSGNRGRCAQPCRKLYERKNGQEQYLLSPKELCALSLLPELVEAGMDSLKIEGRMKRPEYTAFVTSIYRKYMDLYEALGKKEYLSYLSSHKEEWERDRRNLAELYNREGFTEGYFAGDAGDMNHRKAGERGKMLADRRPNHGGVLVGRVLSVREKQVVYEALLDIHAQDVVEFRNHEMLSVYEYTLGNDVGKGEKVFANYKKGVKISVNDRVYRTKNAELLLKIRQTLLEPKKRIPASGTFTAEKGKEMSLRVSAYDISTTVFGGLCESAKNHAATEEEVRKTLMRTGESEFFFDSLTLNMESGLFLNVGALKNLRRNALAELEKKILERSERQSAKVEEKRNGKNGASSAFLMEFSASVMTQEQLEVVLRDKRFVRIYLHTEKLGFEGAFQAYKQVKDCKKEAWLIFPFIFRDAVERTFQREAEKDAGLFSLAWDGFLLKNVESFLFVKGLYAKESKKLPQLALDAECRIMNDIAYEFWKDKVSFFTLPFELTWAEMQKTNFYRECELAGYGKVPFMVSAQCIQKNTKNCVYADKREWGKVLCFRDEKKRKFSAVNVCKYCYNIIYGEEPLYLSEVEKEPDKFPVRAFRYMFTTESKEEVSGILKGNLTVRTQKGHFYKGVI